MGLYADHDVDIWAPTAGLQRYLVAKYQSRFSVNPRRFEEIVAGIFSDFGYTVKVRSFSGDNGVDVRLNGTPQVWTPGRWVGNC